MGNQPQICGVLSSFAPSSLPGGLQGGTWGTLRAIAGCKVLPGTCCLFLAPGTTVTCSDPCLGQALDQFPHHCGLGIQLTKPSSENLHFALSQLKSILSLPSADAGGGGILAPPGLTLLAATSPRPQLVPGTGLAGTGSAWMGTAGPDLGRWQPEPSQGPGKRDSWWGRARDHHPDGI